jgi:hypothetical protein
MCFILIRELIDILSQSQQHEPLLHLNRTLSSRIHFMRVLLDKMEASH